MNETVLHRSQVATENVLSNRIWAADLVPQYVLEILRKGGEPWQIAKGRFPTDILTAVVPGSLEGKERGIV